MSVIPLVTGPNPTVVLNSAAFEAAGGVEGPAVLIQGVHVDELGNLDSNVCYDLHVGSSYKDHRDEHPVQLEGRAITIPPGNAVIIEAEEQVHVPKRMFGYIVPKVSLLQRGLSNTMSKVDPGYHGRLYVTLFNLGKNTEHLERGERFCAITFFEVAHGVTAYPKPGQGWPAGKRTRFWSTVRNQLERNGAIVAVIGALATLALVIVQLLVLYFTIGPGSGPR